MIRKVLAMLVLAVLALSGLPGNAQAIETRGPSADESAKIRNFVERIHKNWGVELDPADYEVVYDRFGSSIKPIDAPPLIVTVKNGSIQLSSPIVAPAANPDDVVTIQQGVSWYEEKCWERITDPDNVGYMDMCSQWGDVTYTGATKRNMVHKMKATCAHRPLSGANVYFELDECYVDSVKASSSPTLYWRDWSPDTTMDLGGCGTVSLSITVGPVSTGTNFNTCEVITPAKGAAAADMRTTWIGDAWFVTPDHPEARRTGQLIGIASAKGTNPGLYLRWGYKYSTCDPAGIVDQCG